MFALVNFFSCVFLCYISINLLKLILITVKAKLISAVLECLKNFHEMSLSGKRFINCYLSCSKCKEMLNKRLMYHVISDHFIHS